MAKAPLVITILDDQLKSHLRKGQTVEVSFGDRARYSHRYIVNESFRYGKPQIRLLKEVTQDGIAGLPCGE